jgi:hypothetical protein
VGFTFVIEAADGELFRVVTNVEETDEKSAARERVEQIIRATSPLPAPRGDRLPQFLWVGHDLGTRDEAELEVLVRQLEERGIAAIARWRPNDPQALEDAVRLARVQKRLGAPVCADATSCLYTLFNGDPETAYVDEDGHRFFDDSFGNIEMGNPFSLDFRVPEIRRRLEQYLEAYKAEDLALDFIWADWEVDGPIEWNGSWEAAKRSVNTRARIADIDDFSSYQAALRLERSRLQRVMYAEPVLSYFPDALVGNYAIYPNDGYRYWFDYFEEMVDGAPHIVDGRAQYRQWYQEFPSTGYTYAMPVVYTWHDTYTWYDFEVPDYRWFYNMLLVGSNAGKSTPIEIPLITFVHYHTIVTKPPADPEVRQLSEGVFKEVLWHLYLRGHDGLFQWSGADEMLKESQLVHEVYVASHQYRDFLANGRPVTFEVPERPGPVVSGLRWGERILVRRTDFDDTQDAVVLQVEGRQVLIPRADGVCQVISLY